MSNEKGLSIKCLQSKYRNIVKMANLSLCRKTSKINPELIDILKHILEGLTFEEIIFGGHFVLVKIYYYIDTISMF